MTSLLSVVADKVNDYQTALEKKREEERLALERKRAAEWPSVREKIIKLLTSWIAPYPTSVVGGSHRIPTKDAYFFTKEEEAELSLFRDWQDYLLPEGISFGVHTHYYYEGYQMGDCGVDKTYTVYWGDCVDEGVPTESSDGGYGGQR